MPGMAPKSKNLKEFFMESAKQQGKKTSGRIKYPKNIRRIKGESPIIQHALNYAAKQEYKKSFSTTD